MEHLQRSSKCIGYNTECLVCKRYFKGDRGLTQHLARSSCSSSLMELRQSQEPNHCIPNGSKSGSLTDQEKTHSIKSRQEEVKEMKEIQKLKSLEAVNWPPMNDSLRWEEFEKLVVGQLIENADAMLSEGSE